MKQQAFSNKGYRDNDELPLAFDTETDGLGGPLLFISAFDFHGSHGFKGPRMVAEFFAILAEHPYPFVWYAHNAQYDWRYFLAHIKENDIPCDISMRTETDIYQITVFLDGQRIVMRDSLAIFPGTLREFANSFTPELPKGDIDFESGEVFEPENPDHVAYALRDAEILRRGLPRFNALLSRHFGVCLGHTTAGTALKAWQATLKDGEYYEPSKWGEREQFIRSGYYGGLVFLTRTDEVRNAVTFDINSSYPHQMATHGVPWGAVVSSVDYRSERMGLFRVRIKTPTGLVVPIIPRRDDAGYMRWSAGTFETTVTNAELKFAETHGYEVLDVEEGLLWEETVFPFSDFIDKCKFIRMKYKGKPEETLAKLMQNSLYGKFGSRRERLSVFQPGTDDDTLDATPLDDDGYFWMRKEFANDLRCLPQWAVFITAHARLHLLRQIYTIGCHRVIYGDTDSLTVLSDAVGEFDSGAQYGQWKLEKHWDRFRALAPKVYAGVLDDGRVKGAAKGMPKKRMSEEKWVALLNGETVSVDYKTLPSLRVAMKRGQEPAKPISRLSTDIDHSQNWRVEGTRVYPRQVEMTA